MARKSKTEAAVVEIPVTEIADVDTTALAEIVEELEAPPAVIEIDANESSLEDMPVEELMSAIPDAEADVMVRHLAWAVDDRAAFENVKNPDNANIHRTLKKLRHQVVTRRAARVMLAAGIDPSFINRQLHDGSRYNVYAIGKLGDLMDGLTGGNVDNAINRAVLWSLYKLSDAGMGFTMEVAKMCASRAYTGKDEASALARSHLTRHTVAATTAPTQASSTMQALTTLGVVQPMGSTKNPTYKLLDTPVTRKLRQCVGL